MTLKPGTRLGPHEILSLLAVGGMGEVYKGRDTRLDRLVAIKVLPTHLAGRPEIRERFEREAKTIANLKHPHICVLYDIGQQEGMDYLVMEYLEGETLAARLQRGPLALAQVLDYATQIADALDKAHRAGVTHRDIKPGNIMLIKDDAKLLDFGLAKLKQEVVRANIPASELPTAPGTLTEHGTLLGTLHYMSPEQVEGKVDEVDSRTDIFAFGAVLYEMMTGKKAFSGQSQASVIAAVLKENPPPISSLQSPGKMTLLALDHVVKKCLAKEREKRWQAASDLHDQLKWIAESSAQTFPSQGVTPPTPETTAMEVKPLAKSRSQAVFVGLAVVVTAAIASLATWLLKPPPAVPQPVSRFTITLPPGQRLAALDQPALAISPDGKNLVYVAVQTNPSPDVAPASGRPMGQRDAGATGTQQLYLRPLDSLEAKPIAGTEGAVGPFFSPDGQWIGFFAGGKLKKVSVNGGAAVTLASAPRRGDRQGIRPPVAMPSVAPAGALMRNAPPPRAHARGQILARLRHCVDGEKSGLV